MNDVQDQTNTKENEMHCLQTKVENKERDFAVLHEKLYEMENELTKCRSEMEATGNNLMEKEDSTPLSHVLFAIMST